MKTCAVDGVESAAHICQRHRLSAQLHFLDRPGRHLAQICRFLESHLFAHLTGFKPRQYSPAGESFAKDGRRLLELTEQLQLAVDYLATQRRVAERRTLFLTGRQHPLKQLAEG